MRIAAPTGHPLVIICLGASLWVAGCTHTSPVTRARAQATQHGTRAVLAHAWVSARTQQRAKRFKEAADSLSVLWALRSAALDDRLIRGVLSNQSQAHIPPALRAAYQVEQARIAFTEGRFLQTKRLVSGIVETKGLTWARAQMLWALSDADTAPTQARLRLIRVANLPLKAMMGVELTNLARVTAASIDYDAGNYRAAIDSYLRVSEGSSSWPLARLGLAWCQYYNQRPDRTVAILKRLPEGLAADPARALLAAVAVHQMGSASAARTIVRAALEQATLWKQEPLKLTMIIQALNPPNNPGANRWAKVISRDGQARLLAAEIAATKESLNKASHPVFKKALAAYLKALVSKLEERIQNRALHFRQHIQSATKRLKVLLPQLK